MALVLSRSVYLYRMLLVATDYEYTFSRLAWDWEKALALVRDHPFGLGISTSAKIGRAFGEGGYGPTFRFIENGYGQALVSLGWPGLAAFVAMLAAVAFRLKRAACADREANWRAGLCFAFCFSQFFPLLTHMTLYTGVWPAMYWLMAGAGTAAALSPAEGRGDERPSPNPRTTGGLIPLNGARAAAPGRRRPGD